MKSIFIKMIQIVKDNIIEYKGHQGTFEVGWENRELHGRLLGINAIDVYGGTTMKEFEETFIEAVNDAIDDGYYENTELMEM